jgi:hypothetical protein
MRTLGRASVLSSALVAALWIVGHAHGVVGASLTGQTSALNSKPTVYVSDFEIDVLPAAGNAPKPEDDPRKQARQLVDVMSSKVVAALQKAGYTSQRMRRGDARPDSGVGIRGLFAEVDSENHWRRAVIRTAADSGKMEALVSVANLGKPEQKLYEIAPLPGNEDKPGAVITLSPYVPLTKFEIGKDATEDDFQKIAVRIANDLTALLNANPAALSR